MLDYSFHEVLRAYNLSPVRLLFRLVLRIIHVSQLKILRLHGCSYSGDQYIVNMYCQRKNGWVLPVKQWFEPFKRGKVVNEGIVCCFKWEEQRKNGWELPMKELFIAYAVEICSQKIPMKEWCVASKGGIVRSCQ